MRLCTAAAFLNKGGRSPRFSSLAVHRATRHYRQKFIRSRSHEPKRGGGDSQHRKKIKKGEQSHQGVNEGERPGHVQIDRGSSRGIHQGDFCNLEGEWFESDEIHLRGYLGKGKTSIRERPSDQISSGA